MQCRRIRTVRIQCRFEDHEHIPFGPSRCIQWCVDFALEAELYSMCIHIQAICQNQIGIHHWVSSLNRVCQWTKESRMLLSCGAEGSVAVRLLSVFIVRQVCLLPAFDMMLCHCSSTIVLRRGPSWDCPVYPFRLPSVFLILQCIPHSAYRCTHVAHKYSGDLQSLLLFQQHSWTSVMRPRPWLPWLLACLLQGRSLVSTCKVRFPSAKFCLFCCLHLSWWQRRGYTTPAKVNFIPSLGT